MKSKAELQLINNKLNDLGTDIDQLKRQKQDKELQYTIHKKQKDTLDLQITA